MLKRLLSYFWGSEDEVESVSISLDDAYDIINKKENVEEEKQEKTEALNNYEVCMKKGIVTDQTEDGQYVIDYYYPILSFLPNLSIGTKVTYQLFKEDGKVKVCNVMPLEDEWDVEVDSDTKQNWCVRTIICQVEQRNGRNIVLTPGNINCNLNEVYSEFIPLVGDWVDLEIKCEVDESITDLTGKILEIYKVRPVRPHLKTAKVTRWDSNFKEGVLDRNIFFNKESLCNGFFPKQGDKVVAEVIESYQNSCIWRAVKVISSSDNDAKNNINCLNGQNTETGLAVTITDNICLNFKKVGETKLFTVDIEAKEDLQLVSVYFSKSNGQCQVLTKVDNITLKAKCPFTLECECRVSNRGSTYEVLNFDFNNFKLRRTINIDIESARAFNKGRFNKPRRRELIIREKRELLQGRSMNGSARFIPLQIPEFAVPERILNLIVKYQHSDNLLKSELEKMRPSLVSPLTYTNFEDRFHALLHLEEINTMLEMQNYDQEKACFIRRGEYLLLEIENLSERRPSIILGDSIVAYDPNDKSRGFIGCVHKVAKSHVYLKFQQVFHDGYDGEDYSIYVRASRTTFRREHWAIHLAVKNLGRDWLFPRNVVEKEPQVEFVCDTYDVTNEPSNIGEKKETLRKLERFSESEGTTIPKLAWYNNQLNFYQKQAVRNVLLGVCRPLPYIIFGPPGTGKTVTLVETILQILRLVPHSRLLVSAPSNSSADLMALRLIDSGVLKPGDLIRVVARTAAESINPKLAPFSCTVNIEKEGTETTAPKVTSSGLVEGFNSKVIGRHRITVTTCSSAALLYCMGFPKGHFTHIIVDEAGQTTEPSVLIPLAFLDVSSGQAVMAGDPMQLGPVILSNLALHYGLEETLLERLISKYPYERDIVGFPNTCGYDPRLITKLLYNYRSLPALLKLPSQLFYNDDLICTVSETDSKEALLLKSVQEILPKTRDDKTPAIVFHEICGINFQSEESPSWFNPKEASQAFYYVNELFRMGLNHSDIGIITPYKAQVKQLQDLFSEADFIQPKIGTVEEFQGQEFNVIILSTVRSSKKLVSSDIHYTLGFIANPRRLNVSITRAKSLLIILGNPGLLLTDNYWKSVINYCVRKGSYIGNTFSFD